MKQGTVIGTVLSLLAVCTFSVPCFAAPARQSRPQPKQTLPAAARSAVGAQGAAASSNAATAPASPQPTPMTPLEKEEMRADVLMVRKMFEKAIETYQDVLNQQPKHAKVQRAKLLNKIGVCYQELDEAKQAQHYYKKAAKTDKHFASPQNNLGTIDFGHRKYGGAIKHFKKAVKLDPTMAASFSNMGYAYLARKKYKDAILSFRQAILIDPTIFQNRSSAGAVVEQPGTQPPGLFYYMLAKTFAILGNAKSCAHYLKMSRDEGYKKYSEALKDPAFKTVLKDPRVLAILQPPPKPSKPDANIDEVQQ
jgi:tetratricopeptide (TPR) repeat protein